MTLIGERDGMIAEAEGLAKSLRGLAGQITLIAQACELIALRGRGCTTDAELTALAGELADTCRDNFSILMGLPIIEKRSARPLTK